MQKLNKRFISIQANNPVDGDYIILCKAVRGQKFDKKILRKAFKLWVKDCPKYGLKETEEYVVYLKTQSELLVK